jgi:hypothetical protein
MQQCLAVESDHRNVGGVQIVGGEERLHRLSVRIRHQRLGLGDDCRPGRAISHVRRRRGGAAEQRALGLGIGPARSSAELRDTLAVGIDQGNVDAVLRGPAHQPNRQHR